VRQEREAGAVTASAQPRDEVRPARLPREELDLDAALCEVVAEELGCRGLVARRVDGVQADELL